MKWKYGQLSGFGNHNGKRRGFINSRDFLKKSESYQVFGKDSTPWRRLLSYLKSDYVT